MNKMERESFVFYRSFLAGIDVIQDEAEQLKAYKYIIRYGVYGEEPEEKNSIAYGFFAMAKPQIDANNKRFVDGKKGGQFGHLGGAPKGNSNAVKDWEKVSKQPQWGSKDNPSGVTKTTPNVNVNDNVNENVNDNEKGCGGKHEANNTLDAKASRLTTSGSDVGKDNVKSKKQIYEDEVSELKSRLANELSEDVINKVIEFDEVKKGKKIRKYKEPQIKSFITTINTWQTDKEKIAMLDTCIGNDYQGIYRNNKVQIIKQKPIEEGKVVNVNGANIFF